MAQVLKTEDMPSCLPSRNHMFLSGCLGAALGIGPFHLLTGQVEGERRNLSLQCSLGSSNPSNLTGDWRGPSSGVLGKDLPAPLRVTLAKDSPSQQWPRLWYFNSWFLHTRATASPRECYVRNRLWSPWPQEPSDHPPSIFTLLPWKSFHLSVPSPHLSPTTEWMTLLLRVKLSYFKSYINSYKNNVPNTVVMYKE